MKVLVKDFSAGGMKKLASLDASYLLRQTKIAEMYQMLISLYNLTTARKSIMIREKNRQVKLEEIQTRSRARAMHMKGLI